MRNTILALILAAGLSPIVAAGPCDSVRTARWLLGEWVVSAGEKTTLETWKEVSPKTFEGRGETLSTATNDLPVAFKLTECSETSAVFENAGHDFPRRLEYRLAGEDRMVVRVSDGAEKGFEIRFTRRR